MDVLNDGSLDQIVVPRRTFHCFLKGLNATQLSPDSHFTNLSLRHLMVNHRLYLVRFP